MRDLFENYPATTISTNKLPILENHFIIRIHYTILRTRVSIEEPYQSKSKVKSNIFFSADQGHKQEDEKKKSLNQKPTFV